MRSRVLALHRSVTTQSLHYLVRPHGGVPAGPVESPASWRGEDLARSPERWLYTLTEAEREEVAAVVAGSRGRAPAERGPRDLSFPRFARVLAEARRAVADGLGVRVLRGIPTEGWSVADAERFFWAVGWALGTPGAQSRAGELIGHVRDEGGSYDDPAVRGYRTSAALAWHCDAADAVGLLCLRTARSGGASRFVSSVAVFNELQRTRPDLAPQLFEPLCLDTRGDGGLDFFPIAPCRHSRGVLRTFYHGDYFRTAERQPGAPPLTPRQRTLLDAYDAIADSPGMALCHEFQPGDLQLLSNHTVLHSRTAYVDHEVPAEKRHLLRLWVSFRGGLGAGERLSWAREAARLGGALVRGRARKRWATG